MQLQARCYQGLVLIAGSVIGIKLDLWLLCRRCCVRLGQRKDEVWDMAVLAGSGNHSASGADYHFDSTKVLDTPV